MHVEQKEIKHVARYKTEQFSHFMNFSLALRALRRQHSTALRNTRHLMRNFSRIPLIRVVSGFKRKLCNLCNLQPG